MSIQQRSGDDRPHPGTYWSSQLNHATQILTLHPNTRRISLLQLSFNAFTGTIHGNALFAFRASPCLLLMNEPTLGVNRAELVFYEVALKCVVKKYGNIVRFSPKKKLVK